MSETEVKDLDQLNENKKPRKKWLRPLVILGACLVAYLGLSLFFESHFLPRTTVNGVAASCKTVASLKSAILKDADSYTLTILQPDGQTTVLDNMSEIAGMTVDVNSDFADDLLSAQNGFSWPLHLFRSEEYTQEGLISIDEDQLLATVSALDFVKNDHGTPMENAYLKLDGDQYVIQEEVYGTQITAEDLSPKLGEAILQLKDTYDIVNDGGYVQPNVKADSEELAQMQEAYNKVLAATITYDLDTEQETIPAETVASFLSVDEDGNVTFLDDIMAEYIHSLAKKYNTFGQAKTLLNSYGVTVTVPGGNYGWKIDEEAELAQLKEDLSGGKAVTRDFIYKYTANSHGANDYGDSYVEVNLTTQHVFLYENGKLITDTDCVSGDPYRYGGTPTGAYQITYTEKDATLNGADYSTPVNYWMPFNGNVGLHDLTTRKKFGGNIYLGHGSHGCINLPLSAAKTIFEHVKKGDPVLVYTTETNESVEAMKHTQELIDSIGTVTADSAALVAEARASYNALDAMGKKYLSNYAVLTAAEAQLGMSSGSSNSNTTSAASVVNAINNIGTFTGDADYISRVRSANKAYNSLSSSAKSQVTNKSTLDAAIAALAAMGVSI